MQGREQIMWYYCGRLWQSVIVYLLGFAMHLFSSGRVKCTQGRTDDHMSVNDMIDKFVFIFEKSTYLFSGTLD